MERLSQALSRQGGRGDLRRNPRLHEGQGPRGAGEDRSETSLLGTILRYDYEVRDEMGLSRSKPSPKTSKEMVNLASHIPIPRLATSTRLSSRMSSKSSSKKLVKRKAAGKTIKYEKSAERPSNVVNLMEALRRSAAGSAKRAAARGHRPARGRASQIRAPLRNAERSEPPDGAQPCAKA